MENKENECPTCKGKHPEYCSNAYHLNNATPTAVDELDLEERADVYARDADWPSDTSIYTELYNGFISGAEWNAQTKQSKVVEESTHVQDLYAENKKLANLLKFILDIDAMTTMEFCNAYRKDHPTYKGIVDLAVMEMFAVDSNKWHLVKDRAKEVRKWLTEFETKLKQ